VRHSRWSFILRSESSSFLNLTGSSSSSSGCPACISAFCRWMLRLLLYCPSSRVYVFKTRGHCERPPRLPPTPVVLRALLLLSFCIRVSPLCTTSRLPPCGPRTSDESAGLDPPRLPLLAHALVPIREVSCCGPNCVYAILLVNAFVFEALSGTSPKEFNIDPLLHRFVPLTSRDYYRFFVRVFSSFRYDETSVWFFRRGLFWSFSYVRSLWK